jgi:hypothetical protein
MFVRVTVRNDTSLLITNMCRHWIGFVDQLSTKSRQGSGVATASQPASQPDAALLTDQLTFHGWCCARVSIYTYIYVRRRDEASERFGHKKVIAVCAFSDDRRCRLKNRERHPTSLQIFLPSICRSLSGCSTFVSSATL